MRGHDSLIAMRKRGLVPGVGAIVEVCRECPSPPDLVELPGAVLLQVELRDDVARLDLRCLVGLKAAVLSCDEALDERAIEVAKRAATYAARAVCCRGESRILWDSLGELA